MEFPRRILVCVEDDVVRRAIVQVARGFKLDPIEAVTGEQGYAALIVGDAKLGFIDVNVPGMDVIEIVRRVHAAHLAERPKLIAISWMTPDENLSYQSLGFDDHIFKPIDPDRVTAILFALQKDR